MRDEKRLKTIALMGIFLALGVGLIFVGNFFPFLSVLKNGSLSALILIFAIVEVNKKAALSLYLSTIFLSFVIAPNKLAIISYSLLGFYIILKELIEKVDLKVLRLGIKLFCFSCGSFLMLYIGKAIFLDERALNHIAAYLVIVLGILGGFIYDRLTDYVKMWYIYRIKRDGHGYEQEKVLRKDIDIKLSGEEDGNEKG